MKGSPPYWTLERLKVLRSILNEIVQYDSEGAYFGEVSLSAHVRQRAAHKGLKADLQLINRGLNMLVVLGIMEPGKAGPKRPGSGYKRRYLANKPITPDDMDRYYRTKSEVFKAWYRRRR